MHYYQFNIGDYAKHTRHLSNDEDLAYRRLLDIYYTSERPIIDNIKQVSRLLNMRKNEDDILNVLNDFFVLTDKGWTHNRADQEIEIYKGKAERARTNGKKGGRPSKKEAKNATVEQQVEQEKTVDPDKLTQNDIDEAFYYFWSNMKMTKKTKTESAKEFTKAAKKANKANKEYTPMMLAKFLAEDTVIRANNNQFGFDKLGVSRYIKNERWNDEHEKNTYRTVSKLNIDTSQSEYVSGDL